MENAGVQKKQSGGSPSVARALWDPFGFMQEMFGWGRSGDAPLFEVKETDDTFVCKVKVNLTLPDQADVAHAKAELENGELTLVVPKAAAMLESRANDLPGNAGVSGANDLRHTGPGSAATSTSSEGRGKRRWISSASGLDAERVLRPVAVGSEDWRHRGRTMPAPSYRRRPS